MNSRSKQSRRGTEENVLKSCSPRFGHRGSTTSQRRKITNGDSSRRNTKLVAAPGEFKERRKGRKRREVEERDERERRTRGESRGGERGEGRKANTYHAFDCLHLRAAFVVKRGTAYAASFSLKHCATSL